MHADLDILKPPSVVLRMKGEARDIILLHIVYILYFYYCIMLYRSMTYILDLELLFFHEWKGEQHQPGLTASGEEDARPRPMLYKDRRIKINQLDWSSVHGLGDLLLIGTYNWKYVHNLSEVYMWQTFNCE